MHDRSRMPARVRSLWVARAAGRMWMLVAVALASCGAESLEPVRFESIAHGSTPVAGEVSAAAAVTYRIVADSTAWSEFRRHRPMAEAAPEVRFEDEWVLCIEWATQPTGGYGVEIAAVAFDRRSNTLHVDLEFEEPRLGDMVIPVLTSPWVVARVHLPGGGRGRALPAVQFTHRIGTERQPVEAQRLDTAPDPP